MENIGVLLFLVGAVCIWYFIKKQPNTQKRNIAIGVTILGFIITGIFASKEEKKNTSTSSTNTNTIRVNQKDKEKKEEEKKASEEKKKEDEYSEINKKMMETIEENKKFALGTLDENGNTTENGTPNSDFDYSLYVNNLTLSKKELAISVDAGFNELNSSEKNKLAKRCQNIAVLYMDNINSVSDYPFVTVYNGSNALGNSTSTNKTKFKWYN